MEKIKKEIERVKNEEELIKALENDAMYIEIDNPLFGKIILKIKKAGKLKWVAVIAAITATIVSIKLMAPAAAGGPVPEGIVALSATTTGGTAVAILGLSTTIALIKICMKSKSTKVLKKLRENYIIVSNNNGRIKLRRA